MVVVSEGEVESVSLFAAEIAAARKCPVLSSTSRDVSGEGCFVEERNDGGVSS